MPQIITVASIFSALSTLFVVLRLFTRFHLIQNPGKDDYTITVALLFAWCSYAFLTREVYYGVGQPVATLSEEQIKLQLKSLWLSIPFYNMSLTLTKASIIFLYLRIFPMAKFILPARIVLGIIVLYGLWTVISAFLNCLPVNSFWDSTVQGHFLSHLRLPRRQKISVIFVFATGGFACVTSIVRLNYLTKATHGTDPTKDNGPVAMWSQIEVNMGLICACLPPLQPLVTRTFPGLLNSTPRSRDRSRDIRYKPYAKPSFSGRGSGLRSSVSAFRGKDKLDRTDAITITREVRLESSDQEYAGVSETESDKGLVLQDLK